MERQQAPVHTCMCVRASVCVRHLYHAPKIHPPPWVTLSFCLGAGVGAVWARTKRLGRAAAGSSARLLGRACRIAMPPCACERARARQTSHAQAASPADTGLGADRSFVQCPAAVAAPGPARMLAARACLLGLAQPGPRHRRSPRPALRWRLPACARAPRTAPAAGRPGPRIRGTTHSPLPPSLLQAALSLCAALSPHCRNSFGHGTRSVTSSTSSLTC